MFFLVVHGVVPDEPKTILKITQDSTSREVISQVSTSIHLSLQSRIY